GDELLGEGGAGADESTQVSRLAGQRGRQLPDQLVEIAGRYGLEQARGRGDHGTDIGRNLIGGSRYIGTAGQRGYRPGVARHQVDDLLAEVVGDLDRRLDVIGHLRAGIDTHGHLR